MHPLDGRSCPASHACYEQSYETKWRVFDTEASTPQAIAMSGPQRGLPLPYGDDRYPLTTIGRSSGLLEGFWLLSGHTIRWGG